MTRQHHYFSSLCPNNRHGGARDRWVLLDVSKSVGANSKQTKTCQKSHWLASEVAKNRRDAEEQEPTRVEQTEFGI